MKNKKEKLHIIRLNFILNAPQIITRFPYETLNIYDCNKAARTATFARTDFQAQALRSTEGHLLIEGTPPQMQKQNEFKTQPNW